MEASSNSRWPSFLALNVLLLLFVVVAGPLLSKAAAEWFWVMVGLSAWLIVALPLLLYPSFSLAPSEGSRALWKELRTRPVLDDAEFHARFYQGSDIPKEVHAGIRQILRDVFCDGVNQLIPSDDVPYLDDEVDFADALYRFERVFRIIIDRSEWSTIDTSLDGLIRLVHRKSKRYPAWADDAIG